MMTRLAVPGVRPAWFVGASYGGTEDQSLRFIAEGIWEGGNRNRYRAAVRSMETGDRIAIKASYTRRHNLPFDNAGEMVSVLAIKVVGTISANLNDGRRVRVNWLPTGPTREWYFFTHRGTVWRVVPGNWKTDGLIAFAFEHQPQDIDRFRRRR